MEPWVEMRKINGKLSFDSLYFFQKPIDIALNEPRVSSEHLPAFFHPHDPNKKQLLLEERLSGLIPKLNKKDIKLYQSRIGVRALFYVLERKTIFMMHMLILEAIKVRYFKHKQ